ncbi:Coenzyme F420 hydrogenase/dehydrogenase, beta subunit C-terminal domain [Desulfolutivibrio sulfoxidireducens]|uniref:Coenzyme F420 hydrogenase/dehydrogenase, beta subunit C-terminal domain n=1 Tax=Desulfolutivibrio sulfoxidireducens TaxID=2773299 RepID=UPI00159E865F|nr:Coenzyme F420 hydrogenase/dehydrogenase, beta subunit C-terminal domain [Desulfolutivibrio sulfoxidireducens]QLA20458.1 formate dehydrogenase [Desulfolutivibrio sulfoxidireducens]
MATTAKIEVGGEGPASALREMLKRILADEGVSAVMVARHTPGGGAVMPALITDPDRLDEADPLAPAFPLNTARLLGRLTRGESQGMIAAVMRPCEIRAFVELAKLNQGSMENALLIGVDCPGAFTNPDYRAFCGTQSPGDISREFLRTFVPGGIPVSEVQGAPPLSRACRACEHPTARAADCMIGFFGTDPEKSMSLVSQTPKGQALINRLALPEAGREIVDNRASALAVLVQERGAYRDAMFEKTRAATDSLEKLGRFLSGCVNCYNCRVACPVCYCRECVFVTDVFDHEPWQYLSWAKQKGALKLPSDTLFYHLTRLAHMSAACVGCGQCSNACPNDVPVMELFRMTAAGVQKAFDYEAGRSPEEAPPLSVFHEREFSEVTGGVD